MSDRGRHVIGILGLAVAGWIAGAAAAADTPDLSRYQVIMDHTPFGNVTGGNLAESGPGWSSDLVFLGRVTLTNQQVQAVILKKSTNHSVYKAEGETFDDIKVLRIESGPRVPRVVLQRGLEKATLDFQPAGPPTAVGAAPPPGPPGAPGQPPGMPPMPPTARRLTFRRGAP